MANLRPMLEIDGLAKRFGDVQALDGISFNVKRGAPMMLIAWCASGG